ncbi:hypothetical protein NP493_152g03009 [Ridgeia piscesae]|uniref:Tryptophan 5-hydroxylase 2 n=1 Tax=Ridgeia piscesae TaxID=27915 RepID=A0AAD9P492_RIDPI|nr:hypothetical protein NP493_152g03009 [Ridgeia piscesae]
MSIKDRRGDITRTTFVLAVNSDVGELANVLNIMKEKKAKLVHIESRKSRERETDSDIYVDVETRGGPESLETLTAALRQHCSKVDVHRIERPSRGMRKTTSLDKGSTKYTPDGIPWFPKKVSDLDKSANRVLLYGTELDADHPGFKDPVYRARRKQLGDIALNYRYGQPIPRVDYTEEETNTWRTIYRELHSIYPTHACREYLANWPLLQRNCGYSEDHLPQLEDISVYLKQKTGFTLRPVAGYLSSRDFLAGLAFRVFHCTQYIRHSSDPFYTPEPDCCHELLGHMPLFLDAGFAEFSQEIGLASLGASEEQVQKLATCYFFTVEFGLCKQNGALKVYGAGLLSSAAELKHVLSEKAVIKRFEPEITSTTECMITTFQNEYFFTDTFDEAKAKLRAYSRTIDRPFEVSYDPYTQTVNVLDNAAKIGRVVSKLQEELSVLASALGKV